MLYCDFCCGIKQALAGPLLKASLGPNIQYCSCRQLLARLCLVREELAVVAEAISDLHPGEARDYAEARAAYQKLVPLGTAAFLKELMPVTSPERRQAFTS